MGVVAKFFARAMRATAKKPPIVNPGYAPALEKKQTFNKASCYKINRNTTIKFTIRKYDRILGVLTISIDIPD